MLSDKFVKKYMKIAKIVANDNNSCYSRQLGAIIVNPKTNAISMGYNGPPKGTPHCDSKEYLEDVFLPLLTPLERPLALDRICSLTNKPKQTTLAMNEYEFIDKATNCKICPRKLINAGPGERSSLCSCQHAERNAIINAGMNTHSCYMFCWCGVPCVDCAGAIINAGITHVWCLRQDGPDYSPQSRWLFEKAGVTLHFIDAELII